MVWTVIADGDDGLATPVMDNLKWAGRFGLSSFYPMNASGVYALQDLGEVGKEWGDAYLASGKKIYIGGIEFKGGGGGGGLEVLELKSQMEKAGWNIPISMPDSLNESFTRTDNVVITPRVSYVSGTTFIADFNKTDLDTMEATTGWTAGTSTPTIAQDGTNKIQGSFSNKMTKASLNGSMDMYKTFTAFSLIDNILTFSFFPDTITNVARFYVKLESSAGNDKTYYVPVANITAADWNHISIDPNNDVADASTGTIVLGGITKIYFGYTTSSSQTVNVSVDYVVYQPNWILPVPYASYIWDGTNQERLTISSVAGTVNHQRRTYTITALSNAYTVAAGYAKQRNVTISNGQGVFPAGLSGAVALTVYDQTMAFLSDSPASKTLSMSQRFWDEEFKVSTLASTTSTKLYSATDKSGYFKTGDKVIIFAKRFNGLKYNSLYNSTIGYNFKILTLTADATHASSEITLTHAGDVNSGADTSYWYAVRYSAEMFANLEDVTQAGGLIAVPVSFFSATNQEQVLLSDPFNRADTAGISGFGGIFTPIIYSNPNDHRIASNEGYTYASTVVGSWAEYITNSPQLPQNNFEFVAKVAVSGTTYGGRGSVIGICFGNSNGNFTTGGGYSLMFGGQGTDGGTSWSLGLGLYSGDLSVINVAATGFMSGATQSYSALNSSGAMGKAYYYVRFRVIDKVIKMKLWAIASSEPLTWHLEYALPSIPTAKNFALIGESYGAGSAGQCYSFIDDFKITDLNTGYMIRGELTNQTGNKLTLATKLSRNDDANQNPVIFDRQGFAA